MTLRERCEAAALAAFKKATKECGYPDDPPSPPEQHFLAAFVDAIESEARAFAEAALRECIKARTMATSDRIMVGAELPLRGACGFACADRAVAESVIAGEIAAAIEAAGKGTT